jgi:cation transporter-like permease
VVAVPVQRLTGCEGGRGRSLVLGCFMCALIVACFLARVNPDNVATPIAASLGDLLMLVVLAFVSTGLYMSTGPCTRAHWTAHVNTTDAGSTTDTYAIPAVASALLVLWPLFLHATWTNPAVRTVLWQGWFALIAAMLLSSGSGMLLGAFHERFAAMAVLVPIMNSTLRVLRVSPYVYMCVCVCVCVCVSRPRRGRVDRVRGAHMVLLRGSPFADWMRAVGRGMRADLRVGVGGNMGCIYASRRSTFLHVRHRIVLRRRAPLSPHAYVCVYTSLSVYVRLVRPVSFACSRCMQAGVPENTWKTQTTLFFLSVPLLLFFLFGVYSFDLGRVAMTLPFLLGILLAGLVHVRSHPGHPAEPQADPVGAAMLHSLALSLSLCRWL